jgi:hypothetical protein
LKLNRGDKQLATNALKKHYAYWDKNKTATQMIPHLATWLNGRRWEDELPKTASEDSWEETRRLLREREAKKA